MSTVISSAIPTFDLTIKRGDGEQYTITIGPPSGPTVDLRTGCTVWYTAKKKTSDADDVAVIQKTSAPGGGIEILPDSPGNKIVLSLVAADTEDLGENVRLYHDIQTQFVGQEPHTAMDGRLTVLPDATRSTL